MCRKDRKPEVLEMTKSKILKLAVFLLVVFILSHLSFYTEAPAQNFKMLTDVLDGVGGRASSTNFSQRIGAGGQPGVVGVSQGTNLHAQQGVGYAAAFEHGDCDASGNIGLTDVVYLINYTLKGGPEPIPFETGDMNCPDNYVDLADVVYLINYLFRGGPPPCNL